MCCTKGVSQKDQIVNFLKSEWIHFALLFIFALLGMLLPDSTTESQMAANGEMAGYAQTLDFTVSMNGNEVDIEDTFWQKDETVNRHHIDDANVVMDGDLLTIAVGPVALLWPFVIHCIFKIFTNQWYDFVWPDWVAYMYSYLLAMSLAYISSKPMKYYVSWWRPDFYHRCNMIVVDDTFVNDPECTLGDDNSELRKGLESFPSGHSCYLFCCAVLTVFWTLSKLNMLKKSTNNFTLKCSSLCGCDNSDDEAHSNSDDDRNSHRNNGSEPSDEDKLAYAKMTESLRMFDLNHWRYYPCVQLLISFPLWIAGWIACARVVEQRHFPADIIGGCMLGVVCGYMGFVSQFTISNEHSYRVLKAFFPATYLKQQYGPAWQTIVGPDVALKCEQSERRDDVPHSSHYCFQNRQLSTKNT